VSQLGPSIRGASTGALLTRPLRIPNGHRSVGDRAIREDHVAVGQHDDARVHAVGIHVRGSVGGRTVEASTVTGNATVRRAPIVVAAACEGEDEKRREEGHVSESMDASSRVTGCIGILCPEAA
jgi:hypothetical protein